jgi:exosortase
MRAVLFPALFLYFLVPIPSAVMHGFNTILQHFTGWALTGLLWLTPTPVMQDGLSFHFPGFSLHIAEECSGVRSTLVLLITSIVAGMLFLRAPWRRGLLIACFLPIAALRNAARILTLALGALHIDQAILDGPLHQRGGTPFFALSLIPLFAIVVMLRSGERKRLRSRDTE